MKRNIRLYIDDIMRNMNKILQYTEGMEESSFCADEKTTDAVIRCIEIIGEAVKNIPETVRSTYPKIPWKQMAGMRDKVIHDYFGVQLKTVWKVVQEVIPDLMEKMKKIRDEIPEEL